MNSVEKAIKVKLEKEGEQKVVEMLKTEESNIKNIGQQCMGIIAEGMSEFENKTGRALTYSEMRELYG